MNRIIVYGTIGVLLFSAAALGKSPPTVPLSLREDKCLSCHSAIGEADAAKYVADIHFSKGVSCADCHGGDRTVEDQDMAMNPKAGFLGIPKKSDIPAICGKCHGDSTAMMRFGSKISTTMVAEYQRSVHGQKLLAGDATIAQCVTCHGVHSIKLVTDRSSPVYPTNIPKLCASCHADAAYMKMHDPAFPIDQYEKYQTSVHGQLNAHGDPKAATCVSCHNPHEIISGKFPLSSVYPSNVPQTCARCHSNADYMKPYGIPTDQYEKYAGSVHGRALLGKKDISAPACNSCHGNHGATPPGVTSISNICGTCHAVNADMFAQGPHKKAFESANMPACETCHSNHDIRPVTIDMLGVGENAICIQCHSSGDKGYQVAAAMRSSVDSLIQLQQNAQQAVHDAEQKGMEVSGAKFALKDVRQALVQSSAVAHTVTLDKFTPVIDKGQSIARQSLNEGQQAIDEYYFRRKGLGVATLIISLLAATLYFKLRAREKSSDRKL